MALGPRLDLRQSQSLVMTPQLQQAIKLLALSNLEIESFIAEELEKNPLLETGAGERRATGEPAATGRRTRRAPASADDAGPMTDAGGGDAPLDIDFDSEDSTRTAPPTAMERARRQGLDGGLGLEGIGGGGSGEGPDFDSLRRRRSRRCTIISAARPARSCPAPTC